MANWFKSLQDRINAKADESKEGIDRLTAGVLAKAGVPEEQALEKARKIQDLSEAAAAGIVNPIGAEVSWAASPAVSEEFGSLIDQAVRKRAALKRARMGTGASEEAQAVIKDLSETSLKPLKDQISAAGGPLNASEEAIMQGIKEARPMPAPTQQAIREAQAAKAANKAPMRLDKGLEAPSVAEEYANELKAAPERLKRLRSLIRQ